MKPLLAFLFLISVFSLSTKAQVTAPPPIHPTEFGSTNYITNGNFNGNLTGWGNNACAAYDGTNAASGSVGSAKFVDCGSGTVEALYQSITVTGGHRFFSLIFSIQTDANFNGAIYADIFNSTQGTTAIGCGEQYSTGGNGTADTGAVANQSFIIQECDIPYNPTFFNGDTFNVRFYVARQTAGTAWVSSVQAVDSWFPLQTFLQWPVFPYQLWSDKAPAYFLCNGATTSNEEACGYSEIDPPPGLTASSLTINVGATSNCSSPLAPSQTISSPAVWPNPQYWNFSGASLTNGTPYYVCSAVTWSNSTTSSYASWKFTPAAAGAESSYDNYFDYDLALVHDGARTIPFFTYDRPSGTYRVTSQLWPLGTSCNPNQSTAVNCNILDFRGMGNWLPSVAAISQGPGSSGMADYAAANFNGVLSISPFSAVNPTSGSDSLTPYMTALGDFGVNHIQITNNWFSYAESGLGFYNNSPTGPASPSVSTSSTGGSISATYVCFSVADFAVISGGASQTLPSTAVCNSTAMSGSTNEANVTLPAASNARIQGYSVYGATSTSSTPPSACNFWLQGGTAVPFNPGQTVTITSIATSGRQPTSCGPASAPSVTVNTTGGSIGAVYAWVALTKGTVTYWSATNSKDYPTPSVLSPTFASGLLTGSTNQLVVSTPACDGTNNEGYFVFAGTNSTNSEPTLVLQDSQYSSGIIPCGSSQTLDTISTSTSQNYTSLTVGDGTFNTDRPSWIGSSTTDSSVWCSLATGLYNNHANAFASYGGDEFDPFTSAAIWYQEQQFYSCAPDVPTFNLLISPAGMFMARDVDDIAGMDAYTYGVAGGQWAWWPGGSSSRTALMVTSYQDVMSACSACYALPQMIDSTTYAAMLQFEGSRPFWHVAQMYALGSIYGYPYGEMRRQLYKQMVECQDWGEIGCGNAVWGWVDSSGMEAMWFIYHNFATYYSDLQAFSEFVNDNPMWLTEVSDSDILAQKFEGIGANTVDSGTGRSITGGKIITNVRIDTVVSTVCGSSSGWDSSTLFPFGPVNFEAKQLSDGTLVILFNNRCYASSYNVYFTLNPAVIPAGQTIGTVKSSVGKSTVTISSNVIEIAAPNTQASGTTAGNDLDVYEIRIHPVREMYIGPKLP